MASAFDHHQTSTGIKCPRQLDTTNVCMSAYVSGGDIRHSHTLKLGMSLRLCEGCFSDCYFLWASGQVWLQLFHCHWV